jgi:dephospho-CoA kinase
LLRVGLTGGLASGKSFVGETLVSLGCHLMKADEVGHRLLEPEGAAFREVLRAFGSEILNTDGRIHRARLGAVVFGDKAKLERLNNIIHPLVFAEEDRFFREVEAADPQGIGVVEAAILIETGSHKMFDKLVIAWCPEEMQIARAIHRGLTREQAVARLSHQLPLAEKLPLADAVVDTSGSKEETARHVAELYRKLVMWQKLAMEQSQDMRESEGKVHPTGDASPDDCES